MFEDRKEINKICESSFYEVVIVSLRMQILPLQNVQVTMRTTDLKCQ